MAARILIIEDNPTNLDLMTYLLKAFGYQPMVACDGEEGLEIATREIPDLVVCDLQLPKLDGMEVARQLRSRPNLSRIPLVAVTAYAMVGDRQKVMSAGFNGYISKPIDPQTFVRQLEDLLPKDKLAAPETMQCEPSELDAGNVEVADAEPVQSDTACNVDSSLPTILVVDNAAANREVIATTLKPCNYNIVLAESVQRALDFIRSTPPDLIISDIHMPNQDGFDFIRIMKSDPTLSLIPFIFISSTYMSEDRAKALALGASEFIIRPIEPVPLVERIQQCLGSR